MRTIVGNSNKNTKDIKKAERIVTLDPNNLPASTNVSQYGAGGSEIKDLETAKHWASEAEKSAQDAATSANKAEDFFERVVEAADDVLNNTEDSFNYLEEIRQISTKIDGQEVNIDTLEKSTVSNAAHAAADAKIASDSAAQARASEANSAASASSANNSAVSSKESEQAALLSKEYAIAAATEGHQILAQTEAVYDKTIDDVSQAVQSYLKDKGGFDPAAGLPKPDSWFDIFGVEKKLSCLWTADVAGTIPETGVGFNAGDILIYNAIVDRYGRFSGELVTGGGGGGPTEFFNDIKLAADKRLLGTDSNGSAVELIKLTNDIVEAGDKTKPMHILAKDPNSAFVCIANASTGFDNYQIYHEGNKPTPGSLGAYTKTEVDNKFVDLAGTKTMTGPLSTTASVYVKSQEVYHPGNKPPASDLDAVSITKSETITGRKKFTQNPIIENIAPQISLTESDTSTEVVVKVDSKKLTIATTTSTPFDVDFNNSSVVMSNPKAKTAQGTTADALVRKDYADAEIGKKLNHTGNGTLTGDLIITGKVTVEGTGSIFKDINTTGQVKENNIRVYSPANKPNAIDVGALPISGGSIGGALHVVGNISTDGTISEKGQRVYSPNNNPTAAAVGALPLTGGIMTGIIDSNNVRSQFKGYGAYASDIDTLHSEGHGEWGYSLSSSASPNLFPALDNANGILTFNTHGGKYGRQIGFSNSGTMYTRYMNGSSWNSWKKIYDEANKPTAADVGAIGIDNVYDKTQADERFWKRTETVNRAFSTDAVNSYSKHSGDFKDVTNLRSYNVVPGNAGYPNLGSGFFQGRMDGIKNQGWSLFNEYNTNRFYFGKQKEDGAGFDWAKIYTEAQKPSAGDVGALPISGGVMTGPMVMAQNSTLDSHNTVARHDGVTSYTHYYSDIGGVRTYHNFRFATGSGSMIAYVMDGSGSFSSNEGRFYSQGFRPSWAEVGGEQFLYKNEGHTRVGGDAWLRAATDSTGFIPANPVAGGVSSVGFPGWYFKDSYITNMKSSNIDNDSHLITSSAEVRGHLHLADTAGTLKGFFTAGGGEQPYWGFASGGSHHKIHHTGDFVVDIENTSNTVVKRDDVSGIIANHMTFPGDFRTIFAPSGGQFGGTASTFTGALKITLPVKSSNTMMKIFVSVYNYASDTSFDAVLSGYNYDQSGTWHNCSALITGGSATPNHPVYFGNDGTRDCIWIGSVSQEWWYPQIRVTKVEAGFQGNDWRWSRGWSIGFDTSLGVVDRTISDALVKPGGANTPADEQPTANTLVKRNASGNISAKGRILIANTNDSSVAAGTGTLDFVSAAGGVYGQVGDTDGSDKLQIHASSGILLRSNTPTEVLTISGNAQKILTGGLLASSSYSDVSKIPANGIFSKGEILTDGRIKMGSITGGSSFGVIKHQSGHGGESWLTAIDDSVSNHSAIGVSQDHGPKCWINNAMYRIYHQGFKPSAEEVGAVNKAGDTMTGQLVNNTSYGYKNVASSGWSYIGLVSGSQEAHIAFNNTAADGGIANSLHLRPVGNSSGSLILQNNQAMKHQTSHGYVTIGSENSSHCHYFTDRPNHWFNKDIKVQGEIYAGADYSQRVYHTANKPTASDVGAAFVIKKDVTLHGNSPTAGDTNCVDVVINRAASFNFSYTLRITSSYSHIDVSGVQVFAVAGLNSNSSFYGRGIDVVADTTSTRTIRVRKPVIVGNTTVLTIENHSGRAPIRIEVTDVAGINTSDISIGDPYVGTLSAPIRMPYSTDYKPSAGDVGALPISGGTLTGNLHSGAGGFYPSSNGASELGNSGWRFREGWINKLVSQELSADVGIGLNQAEGAGRGLSLYGGVENDPSYGIMFSTTPRFGGHGYVNGDWATYFNMTGASNRGWIFRHKGAKNCASISADGYAHFNGDISAHEVYARSWLRTTGEKGWYNETFGGGIYMIDHVWVRTYGTKKFFVDNSDNDAIYTLGGVVAGQNVTAYSDRRVKDNIKNIPNALEKVMELNGVTYTRTDQEDKEKRHTGVIAQEVEAVLPEAVITTENGDIKDFKSVAYGNLVGLLIEAIKEQQEIVATLKQEVEELKNGITK